MVESQNKVKRISIRGQKHDKFYILLISDKGIGIKNDIKNKIFEPDFTTRKDKGGSGIGLFFVQIFFF